MPHENLVFGIEKFKELATTLGINNNLKRTQVSTEPYAHRVAAKKYKGNYKK